ncbi:MAG: T9SS type A sorting domain-containing protein [Paludibacteraceae bacterium]|nr:T9SS type A sorting domain-containing protein [Paludibacteraceae bacterium]
MRNRIYILAALFVVFSTQVYSRVFDGTEVIFVKIAPDYWDWYGSDPSAGKFAYFYKGSTNAWSEKAVGVDYCSDILQITVPAGDWDKVILTRNSVEVSPDWSNVYDYSTPNVNQSHDIDIHPTQNYLKNFRQLKDGGTDKWLWDDYFEKPTDDPTTNNTILNTDKTVIEVCKQSSGDPYSLQPLLKSDLSGYDYEEGHQWFKWDGTKWKAMQYGTTWGYYSSDGLSETIDVADSHTYYFLSTKDADKRQFLDIYVTKECLPTSEITDFGVVTSSVNAHDSTYVLDGIVAFGDANGNTLRISVTDEKGEHYVDYTDPETPLIFSLPDLYADGALGVTATASFLSTPYSAVATFDAPNAITGISTTNLENTPATAPTTFAPPAYMDGADGFIWHDGNTTDHERIIPAYNYDTVIVYTYYEYEKAPEVPGDLIVNGNFSSTTFDYGTENFDSDVTLPPFSTISQYHYWGKDITSSSDFYTLKGSISGGMSIVTDANAFWQRFTKKIEKKKGTHFALFDADNSGSKNAWVVETGSQQPNLKLAKGTNYMFSFWVANINNYGEMNNAAKLQFEISYSTDGGSTWSTPEQLGKPIDLNDYLDNLWHQNSFVYTSAEDANNVRISVRDLNTNANPGGNDFALDDIRFQPISVVTQAIKHCQRFVLTLFEPVTTVDAPQVTIKQTPLCGDDKYEIDVKVSYSTLPTYYPVTLTLTDDIYGTLVASQTIDPAVNPNEITVNLSTAAYPAMVADGKLHTLTAKITRLDGKGKDKGGSNSAQFTAPGVPAVHTPVLTEKDKECDKTTFNLEVSTEYIAFKGTKLHYDWDDVEWTDVVNPTLSYKETTPQTATATLNGIPADGKKHKLRVYSDSPLDCEYLFEGVTAVEVPRIPRVVSVGKMIGAQVCNSKAYTAEITVNYENEDGELTVVDTDDATNTYTFSEAELAAGAGTVKHVFNLNSTNVHKTFRAYFTSSPTCDGKNHITEYDEPVRPIYGEITVSPSTPSCLESSYSCTGTFAFEWGAGDLVITDVESGKSQTFVAGTYTSPQAYTLTGITADGLPHTIRAHFTADEASCYADKPYPAPLAPAITAVDITASEMACNSKLYDATVKVDYENPQGNLIITDNDGHTVTVLPAELSGKTTISKTITNIETKAGTRNFEVYFTTATDCKFPKPFAEPSHAIYTKITTNPQVPSCTSSKYECKGMFTFEMGSGDLEITDVESGQSVTLSAYTSPQPYVVSGITADGKLHTIRAHFSTDPPTCYLEQTYTAPLASKISAVTATALTDLSCGDTKYNAEVKVDYENPHGNLVITDGDGHIMTVSESELAGNTTVTKTFNDIVTANGTRTFTAYFSTSTGCTKDDSYEEPVEPRITGVTVATIDGPCNTGTYDLQLTVSFINQDGTLHANVDGADEVTKAESEYDSRNPLVKNTTLTITGLTADGNSHVYNLWFDGPHGCQKMAQPFKASHIPVVSGTTATVEPYACNDATYGVTVAVEYSNSQGRKLVISDGSTANTQTITTDASAGVHTATATFNAMPMTTVNINHTFHAYFIGSESCQGETVNTASYPVPATPKLSAMATRTPAVVDCSTTSLSYDITVNYTNQNGMLHVRWDGGSNIDRTIDVDDNTPHTATVTLPAIQPDGATHTYIVETDGSHGCSYTGNVVAPLVSGISNVQVTTTEPAFGDTRYDITVTASYSNGAGKLVTIECTEIGKSQTLAAPAGGTVSYTFTDVPSDDGKEHEFRVYFIEMPTCVATKTFTSPKIKSFTAFAGTTELRNCNTEYVVNFTVNYAGVGGNLVIRDLTDNVEIYNAPAPSGTFFAGTSNVISAGTAGTHTLEAWFTSDPTHTQQTDITAPAIASLAPVLTEGAANCNGTVTEHVEVTFANQAGNLVLADEYNNILKSYASPDETETYTYDWVLPADGSNHTLRVYFSASPSCVKSFDFTTPLAPTINIVKNEALSTLNCDGTYSYYYDIDFSNQTGDLMAQKTGELTAQNLGSTAVRWLVEGQQTTAGTVDIAKVWFSGSPECQYSITETFPDAVSFSITSTVSELNCDGTFDFNAQVSFRGAKGSLVVLDEFGAEIAREDSPVSPYLFSYNLPADGYAHTIQTYFTDAPACYGGGAVTAPLAMTVNSLSETHSVVYCKETAYELYLTVTATNPQHDIIIAEGTTELGRIAVVPMMGDETYNLTLKLQTDEAEHTLRAYFDGCPAGSVQTLTYTTPSPNKCIDYYESVCLGQSFSGHGLTLGQQWVIGDYEYQVKDSTIHLHVMSEPAFNVLRTEPSCNTSAEVLVPFSVVDGEPDHYDIVFDDARFSNITASEITDGYLHIPMPAVVPPAGVYTATAILYAAGSDFAIGPRCEVAKLFYFEIAEDGLLYSKWTDVLLVNNAEDRFVAYQWYNNNQLMEGETQQRLYNPDGLDGRYYCLLTTVDGKQIKTCAVEFADAPRSAELEQPTEISPHYLHQGERLRVVRAMQGQATVTFYSSTGKLVMRTTINEAIETIAVPEDTGLFIVVIDDTNNRLTDKIIIQ